MVAVFSLQISQIWVQAIPAVFGTGREPVKVKGISI